MEQGQLVVLDNGVVCSKWNVHVNEPKELLIVDRIKARFAVPSFYYRVRVHVLGPGGTLVRDCGLTTGLAGAFKVCMFLLALEVHLLDHPNIANMGVVDGCSGSLRSAFVLFNNGVRARVQNGRRRSALSRA